MVAARPLREFTQFLTHIPSHGTVECGWVTGGADALRGAERVDIMHSRRLQVSVRRIAQRRVYEIKT